MLLLQQRLLVLMIKRALPILARQPLVKTVYLIMEHAIKTVSYESLTLIMASRSLLHSHNQQISRLMAEWSVVFPALLVETMLMRVRPIRKRLMS